VIGLECKCQYGILHRQSRDTLESYYIRESQCSVMSIMLQQDHSCTKLSKLSDISVSDKCRPTYRTFICKVYRPTFLGQRQPILLKKKLRTFLQLGSARLGSARTFSGSVFAASASDYRSNWCNQQTRRRSACALWITPITVERDTAECTSNEFIILWSNVMIVIL